MSLKHRIALSTIFVVWLLAGLLVTAPAVTEAANTADQRLLVAADHPSRFTCTLVGLAASLTECRAAPPAGFRLYVTDAVVQTTTATSGQFALQSGTGTNCGTGTAAVMPSNSTGSRFNAPVVSGAALSIRLATPLALTAGHALCVIGTATNTITIQIVGYIAP